MAVSLLFDKWDGIARSAELSECGRYRWWLSRALPGDGQGVVCFVMLNPSTADGKLDDPTIRRCIGFARAWGFGRLSVRNLFALRATDPSELATANDPTGGERGDNELMAARTADLVVCAWGAHRFARQRAIQAIGMWGKTPLSCLGTTKHGYPRHPLFVRANKELEPYRP